MTIEETLFKFENKYPFLYEIEVNGFPVYTCFRDLLFFLLSGKDKGNNTAFKEEKGRIYPKRILDSFVKLIQFRKAKTLIFTSTMFRRDYGRNLAVEFLTDRYPDAVVFEWPSRTDAYDSAYFKDRNRHQYCPLDFYVLVYKIYVKIHRKERSKLEEQCRSRLRKAFDAAPIPESDVEKKAIELLMNKIPESYATTALSHQLFRKFFSKYKHIEYAVDFWGSARENIFPVLPGNFESIELQHGIITASHPGYMYPVGANNRCKRFFDRTLLVYGTATKELLVKKSVFMESQIEVIGNPRINGYKKENQDKISNRNLILFASQPYEQDGIGSGYYQTMLSYLKKIEEVIETDPLFEEYKLAVKLHPRENNGVKQLYKKELKKVEVYDNTSQLFELLSQSWIHLAATSTTLYEAAEFDVPTVSITYAGISLSDIYGFEPWKMDSVEQVSEMLHQCKDSEKYGDYLSYLKSQTRKYM